MIELENSNKHSKRAPSPFAQAGPRGVDVITFRKSLEGFSAAEKNLAEGVNASIRYLYLETCSCEK